VAEVFAFPGSFAGPDPFDEVDLVDATAVEALLDTVTTVP